MSTDTEAFRTDENPEPEQHERDEGYDRGEEYERAEEYDRSGQGEPYEAYAPTGQTEYSEQAGQTEYSEQAAEPDELPGSELPGDELPESELSGSADQAVAESTVPEVLESTATEPTATEPTATEPTAAEPEGVALPENVGEHGVGVGGEPLIAGAEREEFLSRWSRIQLSFVADPPAAVESAATLMQDIGAALLTGFQERREEFATAGRAASDTEQQRLTLRRYHAFIGEILPE
jgi:hypothetical protein